jgi:hypothetical protein
MYVVFDKSKVSRGLESRACSMTGHKSSHCSLSNRDGTEITA